jgi:hypothetical protein
MEVTHTMSLQNKKAWLHLNPTGIAMIHIIRLMPREPHHTERYKAVGNNELKPLHK